MKITRELLLQRFAAGFDRRLNEVDTLAASGDFDGLYGAFHSLAGIGGTYGHPEVTELARTGEELCGRRDLAGARRLIGELSRIRDRWMRQAA